MKHHVNVKKIRLDEQGHLEIQRKFGLESVMCPFAPRDNEDDLELCGDWCSLFGEPETNELCICQDRILTSEVNVIDDREPVEEDELEGTCSDCEQDECQCEKEKE